MTDILACIDGSGFTESVCDHAAWLAGRTGGRVRILHAVDEGAPPSFRNADELAAHAAQRLRNEGVSDVTGQQATGGLIEAAGASGADIIVMGKRGLAAESDRRTLGRHVEPMVRSTAVPICLAPKLFLPISRALVLLDADINHRTAVTFVASQSDISDLDCDLLVVAEPGQSADEKIEWARKELSALSVEVMSVEASGLDGAVAHYMESRRSDLMVISRQVLIPGAETHLARVERRGLWSWRTPVLVC